MQSSAAPLAFLRLKDRQAISPRITQLSLKAVRQILRVANGGKAQPSGRVKESMDIFNGQGHNSTELDGLSDRGGPKTRIEVESDVSTFEMKPNPIPVGRDRLDA